MSLVHGILGIGAYVPYWRLDLSTVADVAGSGGRKGTRAVASYDQDATTLAVEAARVAYRRVARSCPSTPSGSPRRRRPTSTGRTRPRCMPPCDCPRSAAPTTSWVRCAAPWARCAPRSPSPVPRSPSPPTCGAASPAAPTSPTSVTARPHSSSATTATAPFSPRWTAGSRRPESSSIAGVSPASPVRSVWEERFGELRYTELGGDALDPALEGGRHRTRRGRPSHRDGHPRARVSAPWPSGAAWPPTHSWTTWARSWGTPASPTPSCCWLASLERAEPGRDDRAAGAGRRCRGRSCSAPRRRWRASAPRRPRSTTRWPTPDRSPTAATWPGAASCPSSRPAGPSRPGPLRRRRDVRCPGSSASRPREPTDGTVHLPPRARRGRAPVHGRGAEAR